MRTKHMCNTPAVEVASYYVATRHSLHTILAATPEQHSHLAVCRPLTVVSRKIAAVAVSQTIRPTHGSVHVLALEVTFGILIGFPVL